MISQEDLMERLCRYWNMDMDTLYQRRENQPLFHRGLSLKDSHLYLDALANCRDKVCTISADYDPDGIFSGLILYYTLKNLGYTVNILPPSPTNGYGLTVSALNELLEHFPDTQVILTVDNGISAFDGIDYAKSLGLTVLVTDHHLQKEGLPLPNADVVVNPNRLDDAFLFKGISGTSVIWKLMLEFVRRFDTSSDNMLLRDLRELYPFVGITTISDVMPLLDENVYLMRQTLKSLNTLDFIESRNSDVYNHYQPLWIGLYAFHEYLLAFNKFSGNRYDVDTIGFYIAPMLNSVRRLLDSSKLGFEVFMQSTFSNAYAHVLKLAETNELRKSIMQRLYSEVDDVPLSSRVLLTNIHGGLVGLMAGRMVERLGGACLVLTPGLEDATMSAFVLDDVSSLGDDAVVSGSGRAAIGIDLLKTLSIIHLEHPEWLHHFGGHAAACGVGVYLKYFDVFSKRFDELINQQLSLVRADADVYPLFVSLIDRSNFSIYLETSSDVLDFVSLVNALDVFGPFGPGFPKPLFQFELSMSDFELQGLTLQEDGSFKHMKARHRELPIEILEWNHRNVLTSAFERGDTLTFYTPVRSNQFRDRITMQLTI